MVKFMVFMLFFGSIFGRSAGILACVRACDACIGSQICAQLLRIIVTSASGRSRCQLPRPAQHAIVGSWVLSPADCCVILVGVNQLDRVGLEDIILLCSIMLIVFPLFVDQEAARAC